MKYVGQDLILRGTKMLKQLASITAVLAVLLSVPGTSLAKCLTFSAFPDNALVLVLKGFTVPVSGACASVVGFTGGTSATTVDIPIRGGACTSSDGSKLSITLTGSNPQGGGNFFSVQRHSLYRQKPVRITNNSW
jgi:hypothetical protein